MSHSGRLAGFAVLLGLVAGAGLSPVAAQSAAEDQLPLWEVGLGAVGRVSPDYPASGDYGASGSPLPYVIYRGDLFRLGGDSSATIVPIETRRFSIAVSVDGSSAVESSESGLRGGLPDLDALAEFGPEFILHGPRISYGAGEEARYDLTLQARGVFSLGDDVEYEGLVVRPAVRYRRIGLFGPGSRVSVSAGPVFATEGVQDLFFEVDATSPSGFPAFDAQGGYLGTELGFDLRYPLTRRLALIGGASMNLHSGAENQNSPLFEKEVTGSAFVGFTYSFFQSKERAPANR